MSPILSAPHINIQCATHMKSKEFWYVRILGSRMAVWEPRCLVLARVHPVAKPFLSVHEVLNQMFQLLFHPVVVSQLRISATSMAVYSATNVWWRECCICNLCNCSWKSPSPPPPHRPRHESPHNNSHSGWRVLATFAFLVTCRLNTRAWHWVRCWMVIGWPCPSMTSNSKVCVHCWTC